MSTPIEILSVTDYRILSYINNKKSVPRDTIAKRFPRAVALDYRLSILAEPSCRYGGNIPFPMPESGYIEEAGGLSTSRRWVKKHSRTTA